VAVLRFVDAISASPGVRLNLNDLTSPLWTMNPETSFGVPAMRRSMASSMLADGEYVGASAYGNRELTLVLNLHATGDTAATQLQALQRELDRPMNLLQYTPGSVTNSVFFRTFRSSPDSIRFDPTLKRVRVQLLAEPFALGLRQDISSVIVRNDPALTNGLFMDITGIKGDVETPLLIETTRGATYFQRGMVLAVRPKTGSLPYPNIFRQAEALTMGTNTTVVADAAFSGGSKTRCTFGTGTMVTRLSGVFPTATVPAGAENLGTYRVFARVAKTVALDPINMRIGLSLDSGTRTIYGLTFNIPSGAGTNAVLMDLGTISIGDAFPDSPGYDTTLYRAETLPTLLIEAENLDAPSGNLDIDYIALVPADYRLGSWSSVSSTTDASARAVIDSVNEMVYGGKATTGATPGVFAETTPSSLTGAFPYVMPGDNRLVMLETGWVSEIVAQATVVCRYWPRYVLARPVST
jgi:hypothetical protein